MKPQLRVMGDSTCSGLYALPALFVHHTHCFVDLEQYQSRQSQDKARDDEDCFWQPDF